MKRKISLLFVALGLFVALFAFASCGEHEHTYGDWETDGVSHWKKCLVEDCTEISEKASHTLKAESSKRAECEAPGETVEVCEVCKYKKTTATDPLGHDYKEKTVKKTCDSDGYTLVTCKRSGCKYSEQKDVIPKGHEIEKNVVAPTCTEDGYTEVACTTFRCDYEEVIDIVPKLGHDEVISVVAPTCTTEGFTGVTCTRCAFAEIRDETAVVPHSYKEQVIMPTCLTGGYTANVCTACGDEAELSNLTDPLGHNMQQAAVVAPTCEAEGYTPFECSRCEYTETTDVVEALGHDLCDGTPVEADCRKDGYTPVTCSRCDYTDKKDIVPALGHVYYFEDDAQESVHYKVNKLPTCTDAGERMYRCTRCNKLTEDGGANLKPIEPLGHDEQYEVVAPTCIVKGTTIVTCTRCDHYDTKDDTDPIGHQYYKEEDAVLGTHYEITLDPTCTQKGEESYYCVREGCGILATADANGKGEIPEIGHKWKITHEPWCGNDSVTEFACENVCRGEQCTDTKTEESEEKFLHTYDDERVLIKETCVDYATYECPVCEKSFVAYEGSDHGQPTGVHKYEGFSNTVMPTCTEKGYTVYTCVAGNCGTIENRDYTNLIAHDLGAILENGTVSCRVCNKSYMDVTAENVKGSDKICICGQEPCICEGTSADWEGFAKPGDPYSITANEMFVMTEVVWSEQTNPLAIGHGLIVLNGQDETTYTVVVYAEDGGEVLETFTVAGAYVMIDLYSHITVGKVEITATTNATVSFYASI